MYKYQGLLIHQCIDDLGVMEVVDSAGVRSLHFGTKPRQTSMCLATPNRLHATYSRAMCAWMLFAPTPKQVLMLGLGGGVVSKYFLQTVPSCQITVLEYRQQVIKIARKYFALPLDQRLKIKLVDGVKYIHQQSQNQLEQHDLIIIDAFDHVGMADGVTNISFFDACKNLLTPNGMLVINLWCSDLNLYQQLCDYLSLIFQQRLLFLPIKMMDNVVVIAFNSAPKKISSKLLNFTAKKLESTHQIEFSTFIKDFKTHNKHSFKNLILTS